MKFIVKFGGYYIGKSFLGKTDLNSILVDKKKHAKRFKNKAGASSRINSICFHNKNNHLVKRDSFETIEVSK